MLTYSQNVDPISKLCASEIDKCMVASLSARQLSLYPEDVFPNIGRGQNYRKPFISRQHCLYLGIVQKIETRKSLPFIQTTCGFIKMLLKLFPVFIFWTISHAADFYCYCSTNKQSNHRQSHIWKQYTLVLTLFSLRCWPILFVWKGGSAVPLRPVHITWEVPLQSPHSQIPLPL